MDPHEKATSEEDIPRTFRRGPSDPVVFGDGPGTWVETVVDASLDAVWAAVSDINTPARFSEEFEGARWVSAEPAVGATFVGTNRHPAVGSWETTSYVIEYVPEQVFAWAVSDPDDPGARWAFRLAPAGDGVRLRFELSIGPGPSGLSMAIAAMPDKESRIIHRRISEHHANMVRTVEGIRKLLEAP